MSDKVSWDNVVGDNVNSDTLEGLAASRPTKGKGRPSSAKNNKSTPIPPPQQPPTTPAPILKENFIEVTNSRREEKMNTVDLVNSISAPPTPPPLPTRSATRSKAKSSYTLPPPPPPPQSQKTEEGRNTLIGIYETYFIDPEKAKKHTRKRIEWTPKHSCAEIAAEIDALSKEISFHNPGEKLCKAYGLLMKYAGEPLISATTNYKVEGLGDMIASQKNNPQAQEIFNKLLVKYPTLRYWLESGNWPELDLMFMTLTMIKYVDFSNKSGVRNNNPSTSPSSKFDDFVGSEFNKQQ